MHRTLIIAGFISWIVMSCNGYAEEEVSCVDYMEIREADVELATEIGESGYYIPGRLGDLVLMSDGTMLVSDLDKITIEQFDSEGIFVGTIAEEGRGPEELLPDFRLYSGSNDTLIVRHSRMYRRTDFFARGSDDGIYLNVRSILLESDRDRYVTVIDGAIGSHYFARAEYVEQRLNNTEYTLSPLVIVDEYENIIQDSLHMLKVPNSVLMPVEGGISFGTPPYRYRDVIRLTDDGRYVIARSDSSSLALYTDDHKLQEYISLCINPRPVTQVDLDYKLRNVDSRDMRRQLILRVANIKPPFLNIWLSQNHIWLHTDTSEEGKQIVILTMEGDPVGKFILPEVDDIRYFRDDRIYTLHKNPDVGHSIRIYQVNI